MELTREILAEFKQLTGKEIESFLSRALNFFNTDYNMIVQYYSGRLQSINSLPFANFENLVNETKVFFEIFRSNAGRMNNLKWWLLLEQIEEIDSRLKTLRKINKWSRSSIATVGYQSSTMVDYTLKEGQTLERVSQDIMQSANPNDDWVDIAVNNRIEEENYSIEGGTPMKLAFTKTNRNFNVNAVVDIINGKSIYGKDIYRRIQFDINTNDLTYLSYDDTIVQAVDILIKLRKNDNPGNPSRGLQTAVAVGGNRALLNFPIIIRQLNEVFAGDDTLKNFKVINITIDQDNLVCDYTVQTRLDETIIDTSVI